MSRKQNLRKRLKEIICAEIKHQYGLPAGFSPKFNTPGEKFLEIYTPKNKTMLGHCLIEFRGAQLFMKNNPNAPFGLNLDMFNGIREICELAYFPIE